ncbi:alpha-amylase [Paraoerskovia sediminicola]|uniref:Alpha-amylase n=1 Tax=Paraoerskovia sediminicola TaxID=1138587 RepID=A0ABM8G508_9CELL|nr:alpha-amylase family protein [Paraoerskovia sediminicola]BDZ43235.1 alpha-amylase [Paraoerskovia sediminicola]
MTHRTSSARSGAPISAPSSTSRRPRSRPSALLAAATTATVALGLGACSPADGPERASDVGVQLFQWSWTAIADECDDLADAGYSWVLTSPPQEHITGEQWWTAYQPVSYQVESRLGTRDELEAMTAACHDVGVDVVADAVINHMTGQDDPGTGWAGTPYEHYEYPDLYSDEAGDFHHCGTPDDDIGAYTDATEIQTCELVNLADLATETEHVRTTVVAYLEDLLSLGVDGFRIDAAKHMAAQDVGAIVGELPEGTRIVQEVIRGSGEPVQPEEYVDHGEVFEFGYGRELAGLVTGGSSFGTAVDLGRAKLPSDVADVFVDNHDTERDGSTLSYRDGAAYAVANALMLAGDYGTPVVYSGYAFSDRDAGPPQGPDGRVEPATCAGDAGPQAALASDDGAWVCQHRWPLVEGMVGWRAAVGDAPVDGVEVADPDVLAFSRGDRGFVAVNRGDDAYASSWQTSLPAGDYCDVAAGPPSDDGCAGATVTVGEDGTTEDLSVPATGVVALHADARP